MQKSCLTGVANSGKSMAFISVVPVTVLLIVGTLILVIGIILNPVFVDILHDEFKTVSC